MKSELHICFARFIRRRESSSLAFLEVQPVHADPCWPCGRLQDSSSQPRIDRFVTQPITMSGSATTMNPHLLTAGQQCFLPPLVRFPSCLPFLLFLRCREPGSDCNSSCAIANLGGRQTKRWLDKSPTLPSPCTCFFSSRQQVSHNTSCTPYSHAIYFSVLLFLTFHN